MDRCRGGILGTLLESVNERAGADASLWAVEVLADVVLPGVSRTPQGLLVVGEHWRTQTTEVDLTGEPIWKRLGQGMPNSVVFDFDQGVDAAGDPDFWSPRHSAAEPGPSICLRP